VPLQLDAPRRRGVAAAATIAMALVLASCRPEATIESRPSPAAITVDWSDAELAVDAGDAWTIRRCASEVPALCVDRNGAPAGHILMEDLPSLGQEQAGSDDFRHAMLAVRTQTVYGLLRRHRAEKCGDAYLVDTVTPRPVRVAGGTGLRYEASGTQGGRVVERTIGYRLLRGKMETLIEATAIEPGSCLTPHEPTFTVAQLASFEPLLERLVADSRLPEPNEYPEDLPAHVAGSRDPRVDRAPTNGIAISYGLR
jgi:hypothetical protein